MGEARKNALKVRFDNRLRLEFYGAKVSTGGGLFPYRDLDDAAHLTESGSAKTAMSNGRSCSRVIGWSDRGSNPK